MDVGRDVCGKIQDFWPVMFLVAQPLLVLLIVALYVTMAAGKVGESVRQQRHSVE